LPRRAQRQSQLLANTPAEQRLLLPKGVSLQLISIKSSESGMTQQEKLLSKIRQQKHKRRKQLWLAQKRELR
jgi:hypothetical protein